MLALKELRRSPLKFGMITAAIALVIMLTMLMAAMSQGLISGMTAAKGSLAADVLVYQADSQNELERSLLSRADVEKVRGTPGVAASYEVGHAVAAVGPEGKSFDVHAFGLSDRLDQLPIVAGSGGPPRPGEAILDVSAQDEGVRLGQALRVSGLGREVRVIGFTEGRRYLMAPTLYVDMASWREIYAASVLGGGPAGHSGTVAVPSQLEGAASIVAVDLAPGTSAEQLAARLGDRFHVLTPKEAALAGNGMAVMVLAVNAIQGFSLVLGALIIGIFFYVTTLHKSTQMAAVKALGASNRYLYRQLLLQILALVSIAALLGMALALGAGASMPPTMAMDAEPGRWALTLLAVYAMALVGSLFSLRGILRIDPATALDRGEH